jgi:hypothetical protein
MSGTALAQRSMVSRSPNPDYSWVEDAYFSENPARFATQIKLRIKRGSAHQDKAPLMSFLDALNDSENQLLLKKHYRLSNQTYLTLARMAVGIMHSESKFGQHPVYYFKEEFPQVVSALKPFRNKTILRHRFSYRDGTDGQSRGVYVVRENTNGEEGEPRELGDWLFDVSDNSRGPTQIKFLPEGFAELFPHIRKDNLHVPQYAAVATMAYLADAITTLKRVAYNNHCEISRETFLYHLGYIYTGLASEIRDCSATLDRNSYWARLLEVQRDIETSISPRPLLSFESRRQIAQLEAELAERKAFYARITETVRLMEAARDKKFLLKPETANMLIEYGILAGLISSSHAGLVAFRKKYLRDDVQRGLCARLLLGRKRHYPLLHGLNALLAYRIVKDPNSILDNMVELDTDKKTILALRSVLSEENMIIRRMELDIERLNFGAPTMTLAGLLR